MLKWLKSNHSICYHTKTFCFSLVTCEGIEEGSLGGVKEVYVLLKSYEVQSEVH
jgi:hypothetical protein